MSLDVQVLCIVAPNCLDFVSAFHGALAIGARNRDGLFVTLDGRRRSCNNGESRADCSRARFSAERLLGALRGDDIRLAAGCAASHRKGGLHWHHAHFCHQEWFASHDHFGNERACADEGKEEVKPTGRTSVEPFSALLVDREGEPIRSRTHAWVARAAQSFLTSKST